MNKFLASLLGITLMLALFASGCATTPVATAATPEDAGPNPGLEAHEKIKAFMRLRLKDAESAKFEFGTPVLEKVRVAGFKHALGWNFRTLINAKNSYGGYTGFKAYNFVFVRGEIRFIRESDALEMYFPVGQ